jgi:hypothetical protein
MLIAGSVAKLSPTDYVGFTFFCRLYGYDGRVHFFLLSLNQFEKSGVRVLVSGLITFIAAVHYFYMRDYWASFGESPTFFRYVDWVTVPLMCVILFDPKSSR